MGTDLLPEPTGAEADRSGRYDSERSEHSDGHAARREPFQDAVKQLQQANAVWDPDIWLNTWNMLLARHLSVDGVGTLFNCVRLSTERALQRNYYRVLTAARHASSGYVDVDLGRHFSPSRPCHWYGRTNVDVPPALADHEEKNKRVPPPLIFTEQSGLEVVARLRKQFGSDRHIILVTELSEFDSAGDVVVGRQRGVCPYCLPFRSDFVRYIEEVKQSVKGSHAKMSEHLRAIDDPYLFLCKGVTVFRGTKEDGFPFERVPLKTHVIGASMPPGRPPVQSVYGPEGASHWYAYKNDHTSLADRYSLIGLVGLSASGNIPQVPECQREADLPVLVMTHLNGAGCQPKDALVSILKNWRRRFSPFFRSVYMCFPENKGSGLANFCDDAVNKTMYRIGQLEGISNELAASRTIPWHWSHTELKMSCARHQMEKVAQVCRNHPQRVEPQRGRTSTKPAPPQINIQGGAPQINVHKEEAVGHHDQQKRSTCQEAMAALNSLTDAEEELRTGRKSAKKKQEVSDGQDFNFDDLDEDDNDEPPESQAYFTFNGPDESQMQTGPAGSSEPGSPRGSGLGDLLGFGLGEQGGKRDVMSCRSSCVSTISFNPSSFGDVKGKARKDAFDQTRALMLQKNPSATLNAVVLAGGIRGLLGFEKQKPAAHHKAPQTETCVTEEHDSIINCTDGSQSKASLNAGGSAIRKSMQRSINRMLSEDQTKRELEERFLDVIDDDSNDEPDSPSSHSGRNTLMVAEETPRNKKKKDGHRYSGGSNKGPSKNNDARSSAEMRIEAMPPPLANADVALPKSTAPLAESKEADGGSADGAKQKKFWSEGSPRNQESSQAANPDARMRRRSMGDLMGLAKTEGIKAPSLSQFKMQLTPKATEKEDEDGSHGPPEQMRRKSAEMSEAKFASSDRAALIAQGVADAPAERGRRNSFSDGDKPAIFSSNKAPETLKEDARTEMRNRLQHRKTDQTSPTSPAVPVAPKSPRDARNSCPAVANAPPSPNPPPSPKSPRSQGRSQGLDSPTLGLDAMIARPSIVKRQGSKDKIKRGPAESEVKAQAALFRRNSAKNM